MSEQPHCDSCQSPTCETQFLCCAVEAKHNADVNTFGHTLFMQRLQLNSNHNKADEGGAHFAEPWLMMKQHPGSLASFSKPLDSLEFFLNFCSPQNLQNFVI